MTDTPTQPRTWTPETSPALRPLRSGKPAFREEDRGFSTPCLIWQGALGGKRGWGYANRRVNGAMVRVHRFVYEEVHGPVADGLVVDHLCRNTDCVNPDHLEAVPHAENIRRGIQGRLTSEHVRALRDLFATDLPYGTREAIAKCFGVDRSTIRRAIAELEREEAKHE